MHLHCERDCIYNEAIVCKYYNRGNYSKIKQQMEKYKKEGFPQRYGMLEANVIVCNLQNSTSIKILEDWWNEFIVSQSMRDQLALPYVLWKNHYKIDDVGIIGNNVNKNYKIRIERHK